MKVIYSELSKLHNPTKEFISHNLIEYAESPDRMNVILEALKWVENIEVTPPEEFDLSNILKVHSTQYVNYLQNAYKEWVDAGLNKDGVMPDFFAVGKIRDKLITRSPIGHAGYYMTDLSTMIVENSWIAIKTSAFSALTAAKYILKGEKSVFSLSRPPGHHAGYDYAGGYCFLNNAAIAAKYLQDNSDNEKSRVCILDIDYHHGNGTQDVIKSQENILYVSIHGHPDNAYPYLVGFEEENCDKILNFPLRSNIDNSTYFEVFKKAVSAIKKYNPKFLVVSYGVDTHEYESEDLGDFKLTTDFYGTLSSYLRDNLDIPILVVMEGGYKISVLGANVTNFIEQLI